MMIPSACSLVPSKNSPRAASHRSSSWGGEHGQNSWEIQPLEHHNLRGLTECRGWVPLGCSPLPPVPLGPPCQETSPKTSGVQRSGQALKENDYSRKPPINPLSRHHKKIPQIFQDSVVSTEERSTSTLPRKQPLTKSSWSGLTHKAWPLLMSLHSYAKCSF